MGTWRFSAGHKGVSRVTVFERPDGSSIYVEWWDDDGRHKAALSTVIGHPVTDREQAKEIARRMAMRQEQKRNQRAAELLGLPSKRTLLELLEAVHKNRSPSWSKSYKRDQKRYREFWEMKLGAVPLIRVNADLVERIARTEAKRKGWSKRTQGAVLRYVVDAFSYAEKKLKWIEPRHNLSAVDIPRPKGRSEAYTLAEMRKLLPALESQNWRAGFIGHVAIQTGRRLTAIRTLPTHEGWATVEDGYAILRFPGETDKARNTGQAVVAGDALRLVERALEGWAVPKMHECRRWILDAEKAAGVPHRKRRAWHGIKRLYATLAKGHRSWDKQSGTTGATLGKVYVQDELAPKIELARMVAGKVGQA